MAIHHDDKMPSLTIKSFIEETICQIMCGMGMAQNVTYNNDIKINPWAHGEQPIQVTFDLAVRRAEISSQDALIVDFGDTQTEALNRVHFTLPISLVVNPTPAVYES